MGKKVTLQDIASEMQLSVSTVHRAVNHIDKVKPSVRDAVLRKAAEMGYVMPRGSWHAAESSEFRVAFLCPDNDFYADIVRGVNYAQQRYATFGLHVDIRLSRKYSVAEQSEQLRALLEEPEGRYEGLVIAPAHSLLLNPLLQQLRQRGTHIVTVNNDAPESGRISFVGEDPAVAGRTAALLYERLLPEGAEVTVMSSHLSTVGLQMRAQEFIEGLQAGGKLRLLGTIEYVDEIDTAREVAQQIITNLSPRAIFTNSMLGSIGCAQAIEQSGQGLLLIGFDLSEQVIAHLENDVMFATISQEPFSQGYQAVKLLVQKHLNPHVALNETYHTQTDVVFKTNIRRRDTMVPLQD